MTDYDMDLILAKAEIATLKEENARLKNLIITMYENELKRMTDGDLNGD